MPKLNGQWIGTFSGSNAGSITVNIDDRQNYYEGTAVLIESDLALPLSVVSFRTQDKQPKFQFRTGPILALDPQTGNGLTLEDLKQRFGANGPFSQYADVQGTVDEASLTLSWATDTGRQGSCSYRALKRTNHLSWYHSKRTGHNLSNTSRI